VTVPFSSCIDLAGSPLDLKEKANAVVNVYRTDGIGDSAGTDGLSDPIVAQQ
jgi:hypothetical protein